MDVSQLEPADRDPKKLRATAIKLTIFMVVSGTLLFFAWRKFNERTIDSDRPTFLTQITEPEVEIFTADGKERNLQDLQGNVTLVITLPINPQPESKPTLEAIKEVMKAFEEAPQKPRILIFVLDGSRLDPGKMSPLLAEYGSEPEVLRVVANDDAKSSLRSFSKTKMRFNRVPVEKDGRFDYDTSLVLLDQNMFVRGVPGVTEGWDFELVTKMESDFQKASEEYPDKELDPLPMTTPKLREILIKSIQYLYDHPDEKGQK